VTPVAARERCGASNGVVTLAVGWDVGRLPPTRGKVFVVTGGNAGIGYFVSEQLARAGARVLIAARSAERGLRAEQAIRAIVPDADLGHIRVDLADLGSVAEAGAEIARLERVDALVMNAGVLTQRRRQETADGNELVFGTDHLGHAALGAHAYPGLARTPGSRLVTVGSYGARFVRLRLDDLQACEGRYHGFPTYLRAKLAQMVFAAELDRRLRAAGSTVSSVQAHPGGALDGLTPSRPPVHSRTPQVRAVGLVGLLMGAQSKESAAWPFVRAALDPSARGGQLYGPRHLRTRGRPVLEKPAPHFVDLAAGERLWKATEELTGVRWPV
jgi:NAD(P)-dependent dehydrogenase (short-subunit alcohol dehydrogenase family)